jgi:hypothetical protein
MAQLFRAAPTKGKIQHTKHRTNNPDPKSINWYIKRDNRTNACLDYTLAEHNMRRYIPKNPHASTDIPHWSSLCIHFMNSGFYMMWVLQPAQIQVMLTETVHRQREHGQACTKSHSQLRKKLAPPRSFLIKYVGQF